MKRLIMVLFLVVLCGCTIRYKDMEIGLMQMQVREGSASVYSNKIYGVDLGIPLASAGTMKFTLGYMSRTEGLIPTKEDGELPNVLIDLSTTHGQNTNDLSDTYATGDVAEQIYYPEVTDTKEVMTYGTK